MTPPSPPDFFWYVYNAAEGPRRREAWRKKHRGASTSPENWNPHCDDKILHAPGQCEVCDLFPEAQMLRVQWCVNFTGEHKPGLMLCPAEQARPLSTINRWGGNIASSDPDEAVRALHAVIPTQEEIDEAIASLKQMKKELDGPE